MVWHGLLLVVMTSESRQRIHRPSRRPHDLDSVITVLDRGSIEFVTIGSFWETGIGNLFLSEEVHFARVGGWESVTVVGRLVDGPMLQPSRSTDEEEEHAEQVESGC